MFTDSPHQMNVRYHTSKLLGPTPSPHPMIRERKKETSDFCKNKNEFLRSKKIARQQKYKIKKYFTFSLIIALGERGTGIKVLCAVT